MLPSLFIPAFVTDASLLLVRLMLAVCFIVAAYNKNRDLRKFAKTNDLPAAAAPVIALAEATAGIALLAGIFPQYAAAVIMLLMLGTMRLHIFKWHSPFWAAKGGWEYDALMFTLASVIFAFGGGKFGLT